MNTKEKLHRAVDILPEDKAAALLQLLECFDLTNLSTRPLPYIDTPENFTKNFGVWEDSRTTEEMIEDIYRHRDEQAALRRELDL